MAGQVDQQLGGDLVELADVTEGERSQEGAQRRRCPDPGEQPAHSAMPQPVQILD
jgi:hypothetical protein